MRGFHSGSHPVPRMVGGVSELTRPLVGESEIGDERVSLLALCGPFGLRIEGRIVRYWDDEICRYSDVEICRCLCVEISSCRDFQIKDAQSLESVGECALCWERQRRSDHSCRRDEGRNDRVLVVSPALSCTYFNYLSIMSSRGRPTNCW